VSNDPAINRSTAAPNALLAEGDTAGTGSLDTDLWFCCEEEKKKKRARALELRFFMCTLAPTGARQETMALNLIRNGSEKL